MYNGARKEKRAHTWRHCTKEGRPEIHGTRAIPDVIATAHFIRGPIKGTGNQTDVRPYGSGTIGRQRGASASTSAAANFTQMYATASPFLMSKFVMEDRLMARLIISYLFFLGRTAIADMLSFFLFAGHISYHPCHEQGGYIYEQCNSLLPAPHLQAGTDPRGGARASSLSACVQCRRFFF